MLDPLHCIQEDAKAVPALPRWLPCPPRMLRPANKALRVGHQSKDSPRGITNTGDIIYRAIGIIRVACPDITPVIGVTQDYIYFVQRFRFSHHLALGVGDREINGAYSCGEYARAFLVNPEIDPAALKPVGIVACQGKPLVPINRTGQDAGFYQHLKTIANPKDKPASVNESLDILTKLKPQLICQDSACRNIIAIGKTPGYDQYLVMRKELLPTDELIYMG